MAMTHQRIVGSHSQERSYNDTKKLSKLFRKAGAGRFSQNIPTYKDIDACGDIYSWGSSQDGVLGHLVNDESTGVIYDEKGYMICSKPKIIDYFSKLTVKVSKMSCGAGHIVVLSNHLRIYSWGCNRLGQLGLNLKDENIKRPMEISTLRGKNITSVHCGAGHSFALDSYGSVYSWGASADYQTGHDQNEVDIY
jgi:alpha-tubulin suppressor-like RCC1 family protein